MAINLDKYHTEVLKKLEEFKSAREWSDFAGWLSSLSTIFKKYKADYVPWISQLVRRLNQLLHPALPGGVHSDTIKCYKVIFECISKENLLKDFDVLTIGVFSFSLQCQIGVANDYLDLLEMIVLNLGKKVTSFSHHIILGFLPFLESESSEFYNRAYNILVVFLKEISEVEFYKSLWRIFIDFPELRICILNFLSKLKVIAIPDYSIVTNALCTGLNTDNPYIIRFILDISNRDFPLVIETKPEIIKNGTMTHEQMNLKIQSPERKIMDMDTTKLKSLSLENKAAKDTTVLSNPSSASSVYDLSSDQASIPVEPKPQHTIEDLAKKRLGDLSETERKAMDEELLDCNTNLIKNVLKIFLKKEVGINKRAYKWLNLGESVVDFDIDYVERGLRPYLDGSDENLSTFFRIVNSLGYRDDLITFLMDRLAIDSIKALKAFESTKKSEITVLLKKQAKIFLNLSLDELYRVFYRNLQKIFEVCSDIQDISEDEDEEMQNISEMSNDFTITSFSVAHQNKNAAEELIGLILYSIETLDAIDSNVENIHIPLLCHLIIRNKNKLCERIFVYFMNILIERSERSADLINKEVPGTLIDLFYTKEASKELLEINLIGSLAKELSKMEIYNESSRDSIYWASSEMVLQDGVLSWTENKGIRKLNRRMNAFFNFSNRDIELIHKFVRKYGFKDFTEEFLQILAKYLCFNYKFVELMEILSFYVDHAAVNVNLWNDFILSKSPKFLMFFSEEQLLPFLHDVLPTVSLKDICIFLKEAMHTGRFIDILFRVASIADTESNYFIDLLVNIQHLSPPMKYIFNKFYEHASMESSMDANRMSSKFNAIKSILVIVDVLIENKGFIDDLNENSQITIEKFGNIGILDVLIDMLNTIIISEFKEYSFDENPLGESDEECNSVLLDYTSPQSTIQPAGNDAEVDIRDQPISNDDKDTTQQPNDDVIPTEPVGMAGEEPDDLNLPSENCSSQIDMNRPTKNSVMNYSKNRLSIDDSLRLIDKGSAGSQISQLHRIAFNILYKLDRKGISIILPNIDQIKSIIQKYQDDYYILKRTIFLVGSDIEFIYENYMHFYKSVLFDISEMPIKNEFFSYLTKLNTKCTVEIIFEAFQYFSDSKTLGMEDLYAKAVFMMIQLCKQSCIVYRSTQGYFHRVNKETIYQSNLQLEAPIQDFGSSTAVWKDKTPSESIYKAKLSQEQMRSITDEEINSQSLVMVYTRGLSLVIKLSEVLYKKNPGMFTKSFPNGFESVFLLVNLPFKTEIFKSLLNNSTKPSHFPIRFLKIFAQTLSTDVKKEIIRAKADYLRNVFGFNMPDISGISFILELFKNQGGSDLSKAIFSNILHSLGVKIEVVLRANTNFDGEMKILSKLSRINFRDQGILNLYKSCHFELLSSSKYQNDALELIYSCMHKNTNSKAFIDAYIQYFDKDKAFFGFGLEIKKKIFQEISASSNFDSFVLMKKLFDEMDDYSFFTSAQEMELQKILKLKRLSFLLLAQSNNKFSTMCTDFVSLINSRIGSTSEIKVEIFKLCAAMLLKIDHNYIQMLYSILLGDFMNTVLSKDLAVVREMFRIVDLTAWMNSSVFDFKVLFIENHHFNKQLKLRMLLENYPSEHIDYRQKKLPTLFAIIGEKTISWGQLSTYLNLAPEYYGYMAEHLVEKDIEKVEAYMIKAYLPSK